MKRTQRDAEYWIGLVVRGFCGAVLGVFIGFGWLLGVGGCGIDLWIVAGCAVLFAILSARFGDDLWMSLREWWA